MALVPKLNLSMYSFVRRNTIFLCSGYHSCNATACHSLTFTFIVGTRLALDQSMHLSFTAMVRSAERSLRPKTLIFYKVFNTPSWSLWIWPLIFPSFLSWTTCHITSFDVSRALIWITFHLHDSLQVLVKTGCYGNMTKTNSCHLVWNELY